MASWVSSTLFFVRDVDVAIGFYVDRLGFSLNMRYDEQGKARVAGVSRGDCCALRLTDQWPDKVGTGVIYIALGVDEFEQWLAELEAKGVEQKDGFWGKELVIVEDPGGNQLYFPRP